MREIINIALRTADELEFVTCNSIIHALPVERAKQALGDCIEHLQKRLRSDEKLRAKVKAQVEEEVLS